MSGSLNLEQTVAIIKPCALTHRLAILRRIKMAGLHVLQERCVKLTNEQATSFLRRSSKSSENITETESLCQGPMIVLCLACPNAINSWKELMGPQNCREAKISSPSSLRALYGDPDDESKNPVHGSFSQDDVSHELHFFFPNTTLEPTKINPDEISSKLCSTIYRPLTNAFYEMKGIKPDDPLEWLANYMLANNKNQVTMNESDQSALDRLKLVKQAQEVKIPDEEQVNEEENSSFVNDDFKCCNG